MKTIRNLMLAVFCVSVLASMVRADSISLTLDPTDGALTGPAGSTVGWGFTFSNSGNDFAVISGSDFCVGVITSPCSTSFGAYTDVAGQQFIVAGPGSPSFTAVFNNSLGTGLGSFQIDPAATGTVAGQILLFYDLYNVDPNSLYFDPLLDTISVGDLVTAPASVTVGTRTVPMPEPPSTELLIYTAGTIAGAFIWRRRHQKLEHP
ncbi:MAG TPA: hypothetical protein VJO35_01660 [Terriglobales bacterium]|nr:hypothetical protein [Terriglobales bacterium]